MKYLYITLYMFFTKIIHLQKQYPPIINITAVLSLFFLFVLMILIEIFDLQYLYNYSWQFKLIFALISFLGWYLLYNYYLKREMKLINEFQNKTLPNRTLTIIFGTVFIIGLIVIWFNRFDYFN